MSGKYDQVLEDKYAKKTFKNEATIPVQNNKTPTGTPSLDQFQTLKKDVLTSDIEKEKQLAALNKPKGIFQRKMERIFGAVGNVQMMFLQGFKMGAIVGGIFGGLMGSYYAIMYRQFMYIPMSALGSGASFGFFMGIGMIMRSEMEGVEDQLALKEGDSYNSEYTVVSFNPQNGQVSRTPIYKAASPYNM